MKFLSKMSVLSLALIAMTQAHAADRMDLNPDLLAKIEALQNGTKRVSVFTSRRVRVGFKRTEGEVADTDKGEIHLASGKKEYDIILRRTTRGQITKIEHNHDTDVVTVNFDPRCENEGCMFRFIRVANCSHEADCDQKFFLITSPNALPDQPGYSYAFTRSRGKALHVNTPSAEGVHLDVLLSEVSASEHKKDHYNGIDPSKNR